MSRNFRLRADTWYIRKWHGALYAKCRCGYGFECYWTDGIRVKLANVHNYWPQCGAYKATMAMSDELYEKYHGA